MHRTKNQIVSMLMFTFLSLIVIILCESESCYTFRKNIVTVFLFLDGKKYILSNIFIGILCSSMIAMIGYIHEYFSERKRSINELFYFYKYIRVNIIPNLGKETKKEILKLGTEDDKLYEIRESLENYKFILLLFRKFVKIVNKFCEDGISDYSVLELKFCPQYIKIIHVLWTISDYYLLMASLYYSIDSLLEAHKNAKAVFKIGEIYSTKDIKKLSLNPPDEYTKELADKYLRLYKYQVEEIRKYRTMMKNTRKIIIDMDLPTECILLDIKLKIFKI